MPARTPRSPAATLRALIARLDPERQPLVRALRTAVRKRLPAANELLYDYGSFLAIAYTPTEHGKDAILTISTRGDGVRLYLMQGRTLKDPTKRLLGKGGQARYMDVASARVLGEPDIATLIAGAIRAATVPLPAAGRGRLVVKTGATQ